jgi:hypothetical protein
MPSVLSVAVKFAKRINKLVKKAQYVSVGGKKYPLVAGKIQVGSPDEAEAVRKQYGTTYDVVVVPPRKPKPRLTEEQAQQEAASRKEEFAARMQAQRGGGYTGAPVEEPSLRPPAARTTKIRQPTGYGDYVTIQHKRTGKKRTLRGNAAKTWHQRESQPYIYRDRQGKRIQHPTMKWRDVWSVVR